MGIHLFVMRSWYFLALAFVGTLHVSIPLAIATYYATREREPLTMLMFVPVFFFGIAYLNVNAMRAVMRSYGHAGEPDFINMGKALIRHVTLDTMLPFAISLLLAVAAALLFRLGLGEGATIQGLIAPEAMAGFREMSGLIQAFLGVDPAIVLNALTLLPYVYGIVLCIFGVSIASGAASASANPPGHLPLHGIGAKFWYILATILVNMVLVGLLASAAGLGAVWGAMQGIEVLPSIGFGIVGVLLVLGYFNAYVVFALAYCAHEDDRKEDAEILRHLRRYGMPDETLDVRALRTSRMKGANAPSAS